MIGLYIRGIISSSHISDVVDPRITAAIAANATMLLMGDLATGTSEGVNVPFTNPWVDVINSNDATLTNFAETTASGWDAVTVPSGAEQMLKADGVDDYGAIADSASIDPTGTEDFAICGVFKTDSTIINGTIFSKNLDSAVTSQIALVTISSGDVIAYIEGSYTALTSTGVLIPNTLYSFAFYRISGVLVFKINSTETYNVANAQSLTSRPNVFLFARSSATDGSTRSLFNNIHLGYLAFYYNGATGLNETDVNTACSLLRAPYF